MVNLLTTIQQLVLLVSAVNVSMVINEQNNPRDMPCMYATQLSSRDVTSGHKLEKTLTVHRRVEIFAVIVKF